MKAYNRNISLMQQIPFLFTKKKFASTILQKQLKEKDMNLVL